VPHEICRLGLSQAAGVERGLERRLYKGLSQSPNRGAPAREFMAADVSPLNLPSAMANHGSLARRVLAVGLLGVASVVDHADRHLRTGEHWLPQHLRAK
jgi:hypothetical protein